MIVSSHFFAYISKIRWIVRWGLKRNAIAENVMEHSWEVATIAHALAIIGNTRHGQHYNAEQVATAGLYHDVSEVITGDMPTPIKYHSEEMQSAFKAVELKAERELLSLIPQDLQAAFKPLLLSDDMPKDVKKLIKAADTIAAYLKCEAEIKAGNTEFSKAVEDVATRLKGFDMPEVDSFLETFVPSYKLTLDELLDGGEKVRHLPLQQ